ncbi:hypothetical protein [Nocardia fluminea]|uniref:hypothetical protein n=1 Tax=Nocardia fluminea TaxID=134984 RepID=UPI0033E07D29
MRTVLARYRDDPLAQELFLILRKDIVFRSAWDGSTMQVSYGRPRTTPIHLRIPGTSKPPALNLQINEFGPARKSSLSTVFTAHPRSRAEKTKPRVMTEADAGR